MSKKQNTNRRNLFISIIATLLSISKELLMSIYESGIDIIKYIKKEKEILNDDKKIQDPILKFIGIDNIDGEFLVNELEIPYFYINK
ncbi:hypothetical protein NUSPORA_00255 [Nucleospora cyclopteri]